MAQGLFLLRPPRSCYEESDYISPIVANCLGLFKFDYTYEKITAVTKAAS